MAVKPIPDGYHTITPYVIANEAAKLITFLTKVFDAKEIYRMDGPNGTVGHAEIRIGDSRIMLADSSDTHKAMPVMLYLYVEDVDSVYKKALEAGGESIAEPKDQFYGDCHSAVRDHSGNQWWIATHIKDATPEEMKEGEEKAKSK